MLIWYKKAKVKTANPNFTWLYFVFPNSFVFLQFNSNILHFIYLFGMRWSFAIDLFSNILFQIFENIPTKFLISLC